MKAKKITNSITLTVTAYPQGQLHNTLAQTLDILLATSRKIVIKDIAVFLTEAAEEKHKQQLTRNAIANMTRHARSMAKSLGKTKASPKRVYTHTTTHPPERLLHHSAQMGGPRIQKVSYNKKFKDKADIVESLHLSTTVSGVFQIH